MSAAIWVTIGIRYLGHRTRVIVQRYADSGEIGPVPDDMSPAS